MLSSLQTECCQVIDTAYHTDCQATTCRFAIHLTDISRKSRIAQRRTDSLTRYDTSKLLQKYILWSIYDDDWQRNGDFFGVSGTWKTYADRNKYKRSQTTGNLHEDVFTFITITCWILFIMRNISNRSCRANQNTHFMISNVCPKIVPFMR
jgi:hypothetical protein